MPPEKGAISFEQFRMLSVGMSEGEVLGSLGQPYDKTSQGGWIYFRSDGFVVTITFVNAKIFRIDDVKAFKV